MSKKLKITEILCEGNGDIDFEDVARAAIRLSMKHRANIAFEHATACYRLDYNDVVMTINRKWE